VSKTSASARLSRRRGVRGAKPARLPRVEAQTASRGIVEDRRKDEAVRAPAERARPSARKPRSELPNFAASPLLRGFASMLLSLLSSALCRIGGLHELSNF
jgi:hypothetical protein